MSEAYFIITTSCGAPGATVYGTLVCLYCLVFNYLILTVFEWALANENA
jgi:hypothetical protein